MGNSYLSLKRLISSPGLLEVQTQRFTLNYCQKNNPFLRTSIVCLPIRHTDYVFCKFYIFFCCFSFCLYWSLFALICFPFSDFHSILNKCCDHGVPREVIIYMPLISFLGELILWSYEDEFWHMKCSHVQFHNQTMRKLLWRLVGMWSCKARCWSCWSLFLLIFACLVHRVISTCFYTQRCLFYFIKGPTLSSLTLSSLWVVCYSIRNHINKQPILTWLNCKQYFVFVCSMYLSKSIKNTVENNLLQLSCILKLYFNKRKKKYCHQNVVKVPQIKSILNADPFQNSVYYNSASMCTSL